MAVDVDVLIVGAGVTGCSIAASLSRDDIRVMVVERRHDVADETSKSNRCDGLWLGVRAGNA